MLVQWLFRSLLFFIYFLNSSFFSFFTIGIGRSVAAIPPFAYTQNESLSRLPNYYSTQFRLEPANWLDRKKAFPKYVLSRKGGKRFWMNFYVCFHFFFFSFMVFFDSNQQTQWPLMCVVPFSPYRTCFRSFGQRRLTAIGTLLVKAWRRVKFPINNS